MIRTERLLLRPARPDDAAALHPIFADERAMRYWSTPPHTSLAQTEAWVTSMIEAHQRGDSADDCIVELDGRVVGKAGFWRDPELGYLLHPDVHGRGYMREALTTLLDRAFSMRRLPRVVADVDPRNAASLGLLARLGFVETGRAERNFRRGDELCDSVFFALTPERWWGGPGRAPATSSRSPTRS